MIHNETIHPLAIAVEARPSVFVMIVSGKGRNSLLSRFINWHHSKQQGTKRMIDTYIGKERIWKRKILHVYQELQKTILGKSKLTGDEDFFGDAIWTHGNYA